MKKIILYAKKVKITKGLYKGCFQTELYKGKECDLRHCIIPPEQRQPCTDKKCIVLGGFSYELIFI